MFIGLAVVDVAEFIFAVGQLCTIPSTLLVETNMWQK
jgi:hypothetical protein